MTEKAGKSVSARTNAMRLLEAAGIAVRAVEYPVDENDLSGAHVAALLGLDKDVVFKTLVARGERKGILVFCIPVCEELDLKKAAAVSGDKRVELTAVKELLGLTGYIRGGCSPVGMKKRYPIYIEETAVLFDEIGVSAGIRGCQMFVNPEALAEYLGAEFASLVKD